MIQKPTNMAESSHNKFDHELFKRFCKLPVFPFFKFITADAYNLSKQKQDFLQTLNNPVFSYSQALAFDTVSYMEALGNCKADMMLIKSESWILELYLAKLDELKTKALIIDATQNKNDERVGKLARKLFAYEQLDCSEFERELENMILQSASLHSHKKLVNAKMFEAMVREVLDYYKMNNWKIKFCDGSSVKLTRGRKSKNPTVQIPKNFSTSRSRTRRILTHEIEVHALRTQNAINSPLHILSVGLDNYLQTEEGLAIYYQQKTSKNIKFAPGFWESYACALSQNHDFKEVFDILLSARTKLDIAVGHNKTNDERINKIWNLCARTYRGITDPDKQGLGTCKDSMYRSGLELIRKQNLDNIETQKQLFAGNIGVKHLDIIEKLDTSYAKTPELISEQISKDVYKKSKVIHRSLAL